MKIVVGSTNEPKKNAVKNVFTSAFPDQEIIVETVSTDSGVSAHPVSGEEAITGALNRARRAKEAIASADYYVGIEGGLLTVLERTWEVGWVVIIDASGKTATGLSSGMELNGKMLHSILNGTELNKVLESDFDIRSAGSTTGIYGLATNDLVTRQAAYEQGIAFALAAFLHPEFYSV